MHARIKVNTQSASHQHGSHKQSSRTDVRDLFRRCVSRSSPSLSPLASNDTSWLNCHRCNSHLWRNQPATANQKKHRMSEHQNVRMRFGMKTEETVNQIRSFVHVVPLSDSNQKKIHGQGKFVTLTQTTRETSNKHPRSTQNVEYSP